MRRVLIMRIKDNDAEFRLHRHRFLDQKTDRGRLAHSARAQNGEMPPDQFTDIDLRGNGAILT